MTGHAVQRLDDTSRKKTSQLCKVCDQIGTSDRRWFCSTDICSNVGVGIFIHRSDIHSVKASALNGCTMCKFILSTIVNGDDARDESTLNGDIFQDCQLGITTKRGLLGKKRLLAKHSEKFSLSMAHDLPTTFLRPYHRQALHLVSKFYGIGRVILLGITSPHALPWNLRAVVLYPFPTVDAKDVRTPFIAGQPFELATRIGMKNLILTTVSFLIAE